jgi:hypothetical protein
MHVTVNWAAAPTTSEDLTVDLDCVEGPIYDVRLYTLDPSAGSTTDVVWFPDEEFFAMGGDQIDVAFAGTDDVGFGATITLKRVL